MRLGARMDTIGRSSWLVLVILLSLGFTAGCPEPKPPPIKVDRPPFVPDPSGTLEAFTPEDALRAPEPGWEMFQMFDLHGGVDYDD